jgi:hypothetical protein
MKLELEKWSLVILGNWNTAILSPGWLSRTVLKIENISIEFPIMGGGSPKFRTEDIIITVRKDRLVFAPMVNEDEVLKKIEEAAKFILSTLQYTPVRAFGQNFHYIVPTSEIPEDCEAIFNLPDTDKLITEGDIIETSIVRSILLDNKQLNLKVDRNKQCHISMNYNYVVKNAKGAASMLENTFVSNRDHGLKLLKDVYGLELEEDADA